MKLTVVLVLAALALAACVGAGGVGGAGGAAVEYASMAPDAAPIAATDVKVYRAPGPFPDGVSFVPGGGKRLVDRIALEPGYPDPADPHVVLGAVGVRPGDENVDAAEARLAAEAGRHGANALIVFDRDYRAITALALRLSSAAPAAQPNAADLIASAQVPAGYAAAGAPATRRLEAFEPLSIEASRGTCYAFTFALESDATLSAHARQALGFVYDSPDGDIRATNGSIGTNLPVTTRSHTTIVGCPQVAGPISVDLQATFGSAGDSSRIHELGNGAALFQLYTSTVTEAELQQQAAESQARWEEARRRSAEQNQRDCAECAGALATCGTTPAADCTAYVHCLERRYVRVEQCR
jgi:hypothetical protein